MGSTMATSLYTTFFIFLSLFILLIYFLRLVYARYMMKLRAGMEARSPSNTLQMAPYFIRLRAIQDARVNQLRNQVERQATDFPPRYEDIIYSPPTHHTHRHTATKTEPTPEPGCTNVCYLDDTGLPAYQDIQGQDSRERCETHTTGRY